MRSPVGPGLRSVVSAFLLGSMLAAAQVEPSKDPASGGAVQRSAPEAPSFIDREKAPVDHWGLLLPGADPQNHLFLPFGRHLMQDQKQFWSSPFHLKRDDIRYGLPFLAFTGALMAGDGWISRQVPDSPSQLKRSRDFSNYGMFALLGTAGTSFAWGHLKGNDHASEAGLLAAEAAINSTAVAFTLKGITQRPRPLDQNGSTRFFQGGGSFPSENAAIAWSTASVLAHEYPGTFPKLLFYGLASGISISRVTAKQHFPSDVVVGSALGWYLGRQVYRAHHDPEVGGTGWGSSAPGSAEHRSITKASSYVPLDSWVYTAFARLAAMGHVQTEILGQKPWTRSECARLLEESKSLTQDDADEGTEYAAILRALENEFLAEKDNSNRTATLRLDSVYTRVTGISGSPLTDGYNFGRTIANDFGRPFEAGTNNYDGAAAYGNAGPVAFYVQAEYQHAPSAPGLPDIARQAVAIQLEVPVAPGGPVPETSRWRLIQGYVSVAYRNTQFSFGRQTLSWGPNEIGPFSWSTNADSVPMLRISNLHPFRLPSILKWLGPARSEFLIGQLEGAQYIVDQANHTIGPGSIDPQPFIHGQKLSFKPTENLEFGFSRTVTFGGEGHPFTFKTFMRSFFSVSSDFKEPHIDAGDRHSGFDFRYRIPGLRKWLTVYTDSFCEDDVLSLSAPPRCAWSPGFYIPQFPHAPKLDFRAEGAYTDVSGFRGTGIYYVNSVYPSGYTNDGNIIGSWVGREGVGVQLWSRYWFTPRNKLQVGFRHQGVDRDFLRGGWLDDISLGTDLMLRPDLAVSATTQYEKWNFPLLAPRTQSNFAVSFGITFRPKWGFSR